MQCLQQAFSDKQSACKKCVPVAQATGGATNFGSAAQSVLSGLANSLSGSQQAASTQGAGVNAQSLGSTVQQATPTASTQQATPAASTQQLPQQASAAGSADSNSGVVSGNTFQSSGQTSPLTPYNTVGPSYTSFDAARSSMCMCMCLLLDMP